MSFCMSKDQGNFYFSVYDQNQQCNVMCNVAADTPAWFLNVGSLKNQTLIDYSAVFSLP